MHKTKPYLYCAAIALLSGCSFIPDMPEFMNPAPVSYPQGAAYDKSMIADTADEQTQSDVAWQNYFQDERLKTLIQIGLNNNRDLKRAALNIAEARAQYGIQRSDLFPDVNAEGSYTRQKTPENGSPVATQGGASGGGIFESYSAGLGIPAYEIDLFGRIRSQSEAALNDYFATKAAKDSVRISLIADIATTYTNLIANQALLQLAEDTVKAQQDSFDIIEMRAKEGVASDLELRQAEILLHQARADKYQFLYASTQSLNALRLLLGTPEGIDEVIAQNTAGATMKRLDGFVADVPAGLPAELLGSRPDIIQAEYQLRSANANIGAARAAFFPTISLTGAGGYRSNELSDLFTSGTQFWQFSPQISVPIFAGGRLKNSLDVAEIRQNTAVIDYEQSIETAFREVSDALAAVGTYDDRIKAQEDLINSTEDASNLSRLRFDTGVESYLSVLDAERELYGANQNFIQQKAEQINAKITLYRTLGGGSMLRHEE